MQNCRKSLSRKSRMTRRKKISIVIPMSWMTAMSGRLLSLID